MLEVTINGRTHWVNEGKTILQAAKEVGVHIPALCSDDRLEPFGACRLCLVEVVGAPKPVVTACTTPVAAGMVIETETQRVVELRRGVLELLLSNHPNDCMLCEQAGRCALQDLAYRYQVRRNAYPGERRPALPEDPNPFIAYDNEKCILCGRCVRTCDEVQGVGAIDFLGRGFSTTVGTGYPGGLEESPCEFCGQCVAACPTGALVDKKSRGLGRVHEVRRVKTTCGYCGTGCTMYLKVKDDRIVGVDPDFASPVTGGALCVKGRYGYDYVHSPDRLTQPLIRRQGTLEPASWEEAYAYVAENLRRIREESGPDALGAITSSRATNEDNYAIQKLFRVAIGTHNIDNCART